MEQQTVKVLISLGSNIDPELNLPRGLDILRERYGDLYCSPVYRCPATGFDGDDFLNMAVYFWDVDHTPIELAAGFRQIEEQCGRDRTQPKVSSRTLDLDLLCYGESCYQLGRLCLPRADILECAYVLRPLADLAPDDIHPVVGKTYAELWREFKGDTHGFQQVMAATN